jgi:hypothetical protein
MSQENGFRLAGRLSRDREGRLVMEPRLAENEVCGGLQTPYLPDLTSDELASIIGDPSSTEIEVGGARAELSARTLPLGPDPK